MPAAPAAWPRARSRVLAATALLFCVGTTSPGIAATADTDYDAIPDTADNCILMFNPTQLDADRDGIGNACDGDLDNNGRVNSTDYVMMQSVLDLAADSSATAAAADLDDSGFVNRLDQIRLRNMLGETPGPSALASSDGSATPGNALVSWLPPTERTDGSVLTNLAGYEIRFGTTLIALDQSIRLSNPGLTSYLIEGLPPGFWYFTMVAIDSSGRVSPMSAIKAKTIY